VAPKEAMDMMFETLIIGIMTYVAFSMFGFQTAITLGSFMLVMLFVYRRQMKIETELREKQCVINGFIKSQVGKKEYDRLISEAFYPRR
jgi:hypothetical protein